MRQPRRRITNAIKAITPATVPPMTAPASTEEVASPVIVKVHGRMFLGFSMVNVHEYRGVK